MLIIKPRVCKYCKTKFTPDRVAQICCCVECATGYAEKQAEKRAMLQAKQERAETRKKLEALRSLGYYAAKAQKAYNAFVRQRDKGKGCISCGTHSGKMNAGHYISVGRSKALRFHPDNVHMQCERCNTSLSGNLIEYRKALIRLIGDDRVEWLEREHPEPRYRREDYERIEAEAKMATKNLMDL